jgi:hypothetical protein
VAILSRRFAKGWGHFCAGLFSLLRSLPETGRDPGAGAEPEQHAIIVEIGYRCKDMRPITVRHGGYLRFILIALLVFMSVASRPVYSQTLLDEPEANPGRPTVSTPATLTPVGYLQFETGFTPASDSPEFSSRYSLNEVIKLAVAPRFQVIVAADPIVHFTAEGSTRNRVGDVFLGAQGVLYHGEGVKPTLAVSYSHKLYDGGAPEFDYGSPTNSFLVLASADVKGFHYDANVFFTELVQGPVRRGQFGQSLTISHPFLRRFTLSGEIWHFTQPYLKSNAVGNLWAVSYSARKNLVFDTGFNYGLTSTSTRWEAFFGVTYLLPHHLWDIR